MVCALFKGNQNIRIHLKTERLAQLSPVIAYCTALIGYITSAKDIAAKIKMLRDDKELRKKLSINGRRFAEKYHDIRKIALEYDRVFQLVIRENS